VESFAIEQPVGAVWAFFQDVPQVVLCLPGLELTGQSDETTYQGKIKVKVGPVTGAFEGEATIVESDEATRRARIDGKGVDRQGGSRAAATVVYELIAEGEGTTVKVIADIKLTGALAQMGRTGIIRDVAAQLIAEFADCLRAKLAASSHEDAARIEATPVRGERMLLGILWRAVKRLISGIFGGRPSKA
jgi:carbon monoxide dehydrogenase subunit G